MPLSSHVPDLAALEALLAVANAGSLNAAAPELGVSQQAVSARIAAMEAQTGIRLLSRSRSGSTLTREGVVVAEWATRVLEAARELDVGLATLRHDRRSRLRVAASLTVAEHLLPGWLVAYHAAATGRGEPIAEITLSAVNSGLVAEQVRAGRADLGFVESPTVPRGVRSRVVARDELVLVTRPDHPLTRRRRPVDAAELAAIPLVAREAGSGTREALAAALHRALGAHEPAEPVLTLASTAAVRGAVQAGAGPAVLSELAVADDLSTRRLARIPTAGLDLRRALRVVWVGAAIPPAGPARDFVALIRPAAG